MRLPLLLLLIAGCASANESAKEESPRDPVPIPIDGAMRADGGDLGDAPFEDAGDRAPRGTNVMFVTSKTYAPNFGGLAGADKICSDVAAAVGRKGRFVAYLSTSKVDAISRLGDARGWVRADGLPFADTRAEIAAGRIFYPPQVDEFGEISFDPYIRAATGSHGDGMRSSDTCSDWTQSSQDINVAVGSGSAGGHSFTEFWISEGVNLIVPCTMPLHLYCFEIDHRTPVTVTPLKSARYAFVSATKIAVTGGLAAGDAACVRDAAAAKLPGTYRALMGTSKLSPISRFDTKGPPWVRVDQVPINLAYLQAPIDLRADGTAYTGDAWVGAANALGNNGDFSCNDWASVSPNDIAALGMTDWTYAYLYMGSLCDAGPKPVFCLQE